MNVAISFFSIILLCSNFQLSLLIIIGTGIVRDLLTYPQSPRSERLLARNRMNNGEVSFHAYHDQDEDGRCGTQTMHELVHFAEEIAKDPAERKRKERKWVVHKSLCCIVVIHELLLL